MKELVKKGAIVDSKDKDGYTPIQLAAKKGHRNCRSFLIDHTKWVFN